MSSMNIPQSSFPRVVIIGGGFGGIALAKKLSKKEVQVVLLDKHNYHNFQPLLYQVSTGGLEPDSIAYPIRKVLQGYPNFYFRLAQVKEVNTEAKLVKTNIGEIGYDYLVVATGSETNFFGNKALRRTDTSRTTRGTTRSVPARSVETRWMTMLLLSKLVIRRRSRVRQSLSPPCAQMDRRS